MQSKNLSGQADTISKAPFDDHLELYQAPWPEYFREAAINVCDTATVAKKIIQQLSGKEDVAISDIIEITRLILLERQYQAKQCREVE